MARRRISTSTTGVNLDSMLDTLMNVVGILVIVLVAVQLSSQEAASRIAALVQKVDPNEMTRLESALEQAKERARLASEALRAQRIMAKDPGAELSRLQSRLQVEEDLATQAATRAASLEKAQSATKAAAAKSAEKTAQERDRRATVQKDLKEKLDALQRELQELPTQAALPMKEVRLPDPRPAPPKVTEIHVLCREQRIWLVDIPALQEKSQKRADFIVRSKKLDDDSDRWLADGKTLVDEFNKAPVKEGGFEMTLDLVDKRWLRLVLKRLKTGGETVAEAVKASGEFARTLRRLEPETHVLRFFVWTDSFEPYLKARELATERGFAAGWDPMTTPDEYRIPLGKYSVGVKPAPAPKDPNAKPPPPKNVLD